MRNPWTLDKPGTLEVALRYENSQRNHLNWEYAVKFPCAGDWCISLYITLPETNIAPENGRLEDEFPFGKALFSGAMLVYRI